MILFNKKMNEKQGNSQKKKQKTFLAWHYNVVNAALSEFILNGSDLTGFAPLAPFNADDKHIFVRTSNFIKKKESTCQTLGAQKKRQ